MLRDFKQSLIISDEHFRKRHGKTLPHRKHRRGAYGEHCKAALQQTAKLARIPCAVMIADHRRDANRIADESVAANESLELDEATVGTLIQQEIDRINAKNAPVQN